MFQRLPCVFQGAAKFSIYGAGASAWPIQSMVILGETGQWSIANSDKRASRSALLVSGACYLGAPWMRREPTRNRVSARVLVWNDGNSLQFQDESRPRRQAWNLHGRAGRSVLTPVARHDLVDCVLVRILIDNEARQLNDIA